MKHITEMFFLLNSFQPNKTMERNQILRAGAGRPAWRITLQKQNEQRCFPGKERLTENQIVSVRSYTEKKSRGRIPNTSAWKWQLSSSSVDFQLCENAGVVLIKLSNTHRHPRAQLALKIQKSLSKDPSLEMMLHKYLKLFIFASWVSPTVIFVLCT